VLNAAIRSNGDIATDPQKPQADAAELAKSWFESSPFIGEMGLKLIEMETDRVTVEMPFEQKLATAGELVHGGAISGLIDTTAALAAWSGHDLSAGARWGTVGLTVSFLAGAEGETLTAEGTVTRRGRSMCFCRVEVSAGEKPVAEGLVTYRLGG
jgi:uncharacterized protein (TIGR00369 family)